MIEARRAGRVCQIALNRPEKRNALNTALCGELVRRFEEAEADHDTGAILISGNGPVFCAGMDLEDVAGDRALLDGLHERLFTLINWIHKPVVAAVHGAALAGGAGLVANCHIAVAAPETRFGLTEIRIGLWPVVVFRAIALATGERRATELSLTGRFFSSDDALRFGLVTEVAADPLPRAMEIAAELSERSPVAMSAGLEYVRNIRGAGWDEAGRRGLEMRDGLMRHGDFAEGVRAFFEKRRPEWPSIRSLENR